MTVLNTSEKGQPGLVPAALFGLCPDCGEKTLFDAPIQFADKCDNCGDCADVCPMEVLILEDEKLTVNEPDECSYCESCVDICPNECITIE